MRSRTGSFVILRRPPSSRLKPVPAEGSTMVGGITATSKVCGGWG